MIDSAKLLAQYTKELNDVSRIIEYHNEEARRLTSVWTDLKLKVVGLAKAVAEEE